MKGKRRSTIVVPMLSFVAAVFFATFIIIQFREDYSAVAGVGIVILIAAYFLIEKIEDNIHKKYEIDKDEIFLKFEEQSNFFNERCDRIEKIQKAIYLSSVSEKEFLDNKFSELKISLEKIEEGIADQEKETKV